MSQYSRFRLLSGDWKYIIPQTYTYFKNLVWENSRLTDDRFRLYDLKSQWVIVFLMNSTGDAHIMLPAIKDLHYKAMTLISVLVLIELNVFLHSYWKPIIPFGCKIFVHHPVIYYFSLTMFLEIGIIETCWMEN